MKQLMTFFILVITIQRAVGQFSPDIVSYKFFQSEWFYALSDDKNTSLLYNSKKIEIRGDTMAAMRLLINRIISADSTVAAQSQLIGAGVDFLNSLGDYWKSAEHNKGWPRYWRLLKNQGFIETKIKPVKK